MLVALELKPGEIYTRASRLGSVSGWFTSILLHLKIFPNDTSQPLLKAVGNTFQGPRNLRLLLCRAPCRTLTPFHLCLWFNWRVSVSL